jgi:hypothetical protein
MAIAGARLAAHTMITDLTAITGTGVCLGSTTP